MKKEAFMKSILTSVSVTVLGLIFNSLVWAGVTTTIGNTPVEDIPVDYYPADSGYWFEIPNGEDAGKKMFFRDSLHNGAVPEETLVFVHGNPESSYTYRKVIDSVIESSTKAFRIVAMDHIGFGLSDQASFLNVAMDHSDNLLQLVRHLDLKNVTLIVHDWGGPIGVGAFLQDNERVKNLVVLNSTVFPMPNDGYTYKNYPSPLLPWSKIPNIMPDGLWGAYGSYAIFADSYSGWSSLAELMVYVNQVENGNYPDDHAVARKFFRDQFQSSNNINMSKRMVRQSAYWGKGNIFWDPSMGFRSTKNFYRTIQSEITDKWGPSGSNIGVRAVLGQWDPVGKDEVIAQWTNNLPQLQGQVTTFSNVGHFIEEVEFITIAGVIVDVAELNP